MKVLRTAIVADETRQKKLRILSCLAARVNGSAGWKACATINSAYDLISATMAENRGKPLLFSMLVLGVVPPFAAFCRLIFIFQKVEGQLMVLARGMGFDSALRAVTVTPTVRPYVSKTCGDQLPGLEFSL